MQIKELRGDDVREAHPGWLIWQLGRGRWWAMHGTTAVTVDRDSLIDLAKALRYLDQMLSVFLAARDERSDLRHRVDQSSVAKVLGYLARGAAADPELSDQVRLGRKSLARAIGAVGDAGLQDLGDLPPDGPILPQFDHGKTIDVCDHALSSGHECKRVHTSAHEIAP